ncbi:MAG TPA: hypothetical protein VMT69_09385 [Kineosporiaceae bacterium]|nr:hypothetical protein [Kineosporiaceae bacterium]
MTPRLYSANPSRLALQVVADLLVIVWIYVWIRAGDAVHNAVVSAASVGYRIQGSAGQVAGNLDQAARSTSGLPLVGDSLSSPLHAAATQVSSVAGGGGDLGDRLTGWAGPAGWLVALGPILLVVAFWLPARWRFARRAGMSAELATSPVGLELLALRALANRPLHDLQRVSPDPVEAWRLGDPDVVRGLAALELAAAGVRPPGRPSDRPPAPAPATP